MAIKTQTPDYVHGTFNLASTDILKYRYRDFREWYLDKHGKDATVPDKDSVEYRNWAADERDMNWDSDLDNIESCHEYNIPVILTGRLGLWWGRPEIVPETFKSVGDALQRILRINHDDIDILYIDGHIEVKEYHHDGTNTFEIRALSRQGCRKNETAKRNGENFKNPKRLDLKRMPYLYAI